MYYYTKIGKNIYFLYCDFLEYVITFKRLELTNENCY